MKLNVALVKLLQFVMFSLFLFSALIYEGTFLLLPLDFLYQVTRGLHTLGVPSALALALSCGMLAYGGHSLRKCSGLCGAVMGTGVELFRFGTRQVRRVDAVVVKPGRKI